MNAARQACRPKHQVLVLKCYPKFQKNNVDVRANSSELSYLLYYASTRRSKLQKVGEFLDKRTTSDVWKGRIGNVQVTLEILKALIEKCPRDLPLYAAAVLRVLRTLLRSDDVTMVEQSVPTFETLCAHQDPASLQADQDYITAYEEIVQLYASFANRDAPTTLKTAPTWTVSIRFRKSGLQALKAVAASESLGAETGRQLAVIIPAVLSNLYSEAGETLRQLQARDEAREKEQIVRRRSISTVHTAEEPEGDMAAAQTTEDADKLAEEEVGVIALQALKNIFTGVNRGHLRLATLALIKFITAKVQPTQRLRDRSQQSKCWSTTLMAMVCSWAPVQDRYAILVSATEALVRSPIVEDDLGRQQVLATMIDYLLGSTINFIGLSVMDVLLGLISHVLLLLQLGGPGSAIMPHHQQTTPILAEKDAAGLPGSASLDGLVMEVVKEPSQTRIQLLETLQRCMASLATHVYYSDQISDMVSAILTRLKPSPLSGIANSAEAIEDPSGAVKAVASSASLQEKTPHVHRFFSFETGRLRALQAVKDILITANMRRPDGSTASVSRGRVGVRVWEGTQWLLRDPSGDVRKAYVDALITWLQQEMVKDDLKVVESSDRARDARGDLARRAVSNASNREKSAKPAKHTFLALLHLAVYEGALQHSNSEPDFLLLHLLLTTLVNKLGVNAARSGLPMIWRLQEDIQTLDDPGAKVMIGSLVHGYFWALSMALEFETSSVGRALHAEISRRLGKGLWVNSIRVPPMPLERIETPYPTPMKLPTSTVEHEALKPFDNREALVEKIAVGYVSSLHSPPSSPPASPGRSMSISLVHPQTIKPSSPLPRKVKEELLADWSREVCIAENTRDLSSASITGSRTGASTQYRNNYLGVAIPNGNLDSAHNSPLPSPRRATSRAPSHNYGLVGRLSSPHRHRSPSRTPGSTSSVHSAVRVEDLKRVLSGSAPRTSYSIRPHSHHRRPSYSPVSTASDSMVSVHSFSEASFVTADHASIQANNPDSSSHPHVSAAGPAPASPPTASSARPRSPSSTTHAARERDAAYSAGRVPPVPPIPASLRDHSASPSEHRFRAPPNGNGDAGAAVRKGRSLHRGARSGSRGRSTHTDASAVGRERRKLDFSGFLDSIDAGSGDEEETSHGIGKLPY
ncbi:hypothetical protein M011DRAFT_414023 [Sporormia fimetaria CBS 119925]|uniref:Protein EFR3 n=1 Tax=Sporormia fimetaria CBS 119925 TaxID=1340428 RepID=A0A6A6UW59_9PLEO|nr:hypothetical protein M011DRAFT_414023 [Sporormia fimetaria CBS 119925]